MPNVPAPEPGLPPAPDGQVTDVATGPRQWSPGIALQVVEKPRPADAQREFDLALKLKPDLPELQEARRRVGH
jgi:hypothetical protein